MSKGTRGLDDNRSILGLETPCLRAYAWKVVPPALSPSRATGAIACSLLLGLSSCGSESGLPTSIDGDSPPTPVVGRFGDLEFEAVLVQPAWDRLVGRVTLTNPSASPVTVRFPDTCVVLLRLYASDESLAIDAHSKRCLPFPVELTLAPGESHTYETNVLFFFVLGNSLPEGRYRATLYLRPEGGGELEIAVGRPRLERPPVELPL
jgi:hypothetical protein